MSQEPKVISTSNLVLLILYWSTSHLYRFTHTWPFTQMLNFHVHAVSLMGEPEQCSPPVWPPSQRVTDGKNNIHTLWKICTRHNTLTNVNFFKYLSRCVLTSYKYVQLAHFAQMDLTHGHSSCCVAAQVETLLAGGWGWTWSRFLRQPKKAWPYSVL